MTMDQTIVYRAIMVLAMFDIAGCVNDRLYPSAAVRPGPVTSAPTVTGSFTGSPEAVFNTRNACEQIDIPDTSAHAFRDDQNMVHLISTHFVARAMVGSSLDNVKHDCHVIFRSPQDADPSHFQYHNWLYSFYTVDGRRIAALVHSEYDAFEIPGTCATPESRTNCWWNTITFAQSVDGGYSFAEPQPPLNLVASLPYRYVVGNRTSAYGYNLPTNILKVGEFYYAMVNDWPHEAQKYGPCLLRTTNPFDPGSWRAWNGRGFAIRFVDPYRDSDVKPEEHVCEPVLAGAAECVVQFQRMGLFIVSQLTPDERFGPPGLYVSASRDLIHWGKPTLIAKTSDLETVDGPGKWTYGYSSLLDPASKDRSFSTISDTPFVYYVRLDGNNPPYARVLFRRKIKLHIVQ